MKPLLERLVENLKKYGMEWLGRYYSVYRGVVLSNVDPDSQGKIFVKVPSISGDDALPEPAYPIAPYAGADHGTFFPPEEGETVYIEFENGDPHFPLYRGGWWKKPGGTTEVPSEFQQDDPENENPKRRGIKTAGGHRIVFDDTDDDKRLLIAHASNANIFIDNSGSVTVLNPNGSYVSLNADAGEVSIVDENGNLIKMSTDGIDLVGAGNIVGLQDNLVQLVSQKDLVLQGAGVNLDAGGVIVGSGAVEFAVLGNQLLSYLSQLVIWASTHTHISPFMGIPTPPPQAPPPPPPPTILSKNVKVL